MSWQSCHAVKHWLHPLAVAFEIFLQYIHLHGSEVAITSCLMRRIRDISFEWCVLRRLINVNKSALVCLIQPNRKGAKSVELWLVAFFGISCVSSWWLKNTSSQIKINGIRWLITSGNCWDHGRIRIDFNLRQWVEDPSTTTVGK